ncbi:MAG: M56 family metallopeptidase [Bryobacteraceae bacterium]|jgi:TonB family protein
MHSIAFLYDAALKATVILAAAFLINAALRRSSAATRYFTWTCALAAILAVPMLSPWMSRWGVRLPAPAAGAISSRIAVLDAAPEPVDSPRPAPSRPSRTIPWPIVIWLAGASCALGHLGLGHFRLWLSLRRARTVRALEWTALLDQSSALLKLRRTVTLLRSDETDVPLACGVFKAAVLLPGASEQWDAERRRVVLLHELTHAARRDPVLHLMARVAAAVYWFHPLAWLAAARFRREQERSCDDAVVRAGASQSAYAGHLVELARSISPATAYSAALGMASPSGLEQRVRALLDPHRDRRGLRRGVCLAAIAAVLAAVIPLAALHAQNAGPVASLAGSVYDASGAAVPRVLILLITNKSTQEASRASDAGEYRFSGIPAGTYTMQIRAHGFAEFQKAIVLTAGAAQQMNITLDVGQVTEAVEVVGKGPRPEETGTPRRIRVGGMVQATKLISSVKPLYPSGAEAAGIEGTVLLRAVISTEGNLLGVSVMNTSVDAELAKAAMDAVQQWRYQPTLLNGEPVEVVTTIAVTFRLER